MAAAPPVIVEVVERGLCVGCGVCVAACRSDCLEMRFSHLGLFQADSGNANDRCTSCGRCVRVCPLGDEAFLESPSSQSDGPPVDPWGVCYMGHVASEPDRWASASGGLATWVLERMLDLGMVDAVACVAPLTEPGRLFEYSLARSPDDLGRCRGSAYYPLEIGTILRRIRDGDENVAVTALPCVAKAVRRLMNIDGALDARVRAIVGLTCGGGVTSGFSEYLASSVAGRTVVPEHARFRVKSSSRPSHDFIMEFGWREADRSRSTGQIPFSEGPNAAWTWHWFSPKACFFCSDVFAGQADITLMDAWLPTETDSRGRSLAIVRRASLDGVLREGERGGAISLQRISSDTVRASQGAPIAFKGRGLAHRLWLAGEAGGHVPLRDVPAQQDPDWARAVQWITQLRLSRVVPLVWAATGSVRLTGFVGGIASGPWRLSLHLSRVPKRLKRLVAGAATAARSIRSRGST